MIPMFQAKEEELQVQHQKLKGLRQEIEGYMEEHGVKLRYVQPMITTNFMNRKPVPKKSVSGQSAMDNNEHQEDKNETGAAASIESDEELRDVTTSKLARDREYARKVLANSGTPQAPPQD